jgi:hypothetical protein
LDIANWLRRLSLERRAETFRDNAIELEVLPELSEAGLEELGVLLGYRKIMLHAQGDCGARGAGAPARGRADATARRCGGTPPADGDVLRPARLDGARAAF